MSRLTPRRLDVLLDALPGDSLYKTAVRDAISDDDLAELAATPPKGHGRWSHTDLLLAEVVDRLGVVAWALHAYEKPPEPYHRPGIVRRRRGRSNPAIKAQIEAIAREHAELHGYSLDNPPA
ncbi:hypothetical protein [Dactylosporangium sp. CA-139066]|uniref:hypothetical protein n=1 Tax=Dactylosporangium sp. CA-139066 TaxID=3239930 RepID=UPI003D8D381C